MTPLRQVANKLADKLITDARLGRNVPSDTIEQALLSVRNEALEEAAKILEGDVLETPDEYEGKTKLKVFDLVEKLAAKIRALKSDGRDK